MTGDGPMPEVINGASFGTALRMALWTVVIVSRRSSGRAARNSATVGRVFVLGMGRGCASAARRSNLNRLLRPERHFVAVRIVKVCEFPERIALGRFGRESLGLQSHQ